MNSEFQEPSSTAAPAQASGKPRASSDWACLEGKLAEQTEQHTRVAADFENFKRRSRQEAESRAAAQKEGLILELLPIIDNLERALACGPKPSTSQLLEGVQMTLRQLRALLSKHGIESEESLGQVFDPHRHEAVAQRHQTAHPDQSILEVFQPGYRRGQTVFRAAKVVVNHLAQPKGSRHGR